MAEVPITIVGGGPVGMTAALLLARYDIPSIILEARRQRDPIGSKALCMQRDVLDILERVGCGDKLLAEGVTWTLGRTYYREHELFQITFPEVGESHYPPFVNIGQDRTEHWLERAVEAQPLIDLRYGHRVVELAREGPHVALVVETIEGPTTIIGEYVIGCDGSSSTVRKLIGAGFPGKSFDDQFLICDIRAELPFANERRFFFDPQWNPNRQVLIHPQANSVWRIDWQVPPDFDVEAEEASGGLEERIRRIVGSREYEIMWKSVYRFHQRIASRFRAGRAFLAGDAAHIVSPFGARGLNSGIQDAENLAWKIGFVRKGWADETLLNTYEVERRAAAKENLAVTAKTMEFLVPATEHQWERRKQALEAAVGNPNARTMVDSGQLATPYKDSPLTTPGGGAAIAPGALLPDATVAIPGRPDVERMRQLFGGPLIVLGAPDGPAPTGGGTSRPWIELFHIDEIDIDGVLRNVVPSADGRAIVIRPDGHVAGIVRSDGLMDAAMRAVGRI